MVDYIKMTAKKFCKYDEYELFEHLLFLFPESTVVSAPKKRTYSSVYWICCLLCGQIEIMVNCPLTKRQKQLYQAIKKKISIDDLVQSTTASSSQSQSTTSSLMNLVMQFRKVHAADGMSLWLKQDYVMHWNTDCSQTYSYNQWLN